MRDVIRISVRVGDSPVKTFRGRFAQTLALLIENGPAGLSSLESPGVRLSHYVFRLRRDGVPIETEDERHSGPYSRAATGGIGSPPRSTVIERELANG
jgi:hypothetical protein